jgi:hypothetical protein
MNKNKVKNKAPKSTTTQKPRKDPRIEEEYFEEIEFTCPVRGKVKQKVKIKKFKSFGEVAKLDQLAASRSKLDELEKNDDGLSIYGDGDLDVDSSSEDQD